MSSLSWGTLFYYEDFSKTKIFRGFSLYFTKERRSGTATDGGGMGVGAQRSILSVNEPQKTDARSAQAGRVTKTQ